jgi:threonine dehydratase
VLVSEDEIAAAMRVIIVLCGANIGLDRLREVLTTPAR